MSTNKIVGWLNTKDHRPQSHSHAKSASGPKGSLPCQLNWKEKAFSHHFSQNWLKRFPNWFHTNKARFAFVYFYGHITPVLGWVAVMDDSHLASSHCHGKSNITDQDLCYLHITSLTHQHSLMHHHTPTTSWTVWRRKEWAQSWGINLLPFSLCYPCRSNLLPWGINLLP